MGKPWEVRQPGAPPRQNRHSRCSGKASSVSSSSQMASCSRVTGGEQNPKGWLALSTEGQRHFGTHSRSYLCPLGLLKQTHFSKVSVFLCVFLGVSNKYILLKKGCLKDVQVFARIPAVSPTPSMVPRCGFSYLSSTSLKMIHGKFQKGIIPSSSISCNSDKHGVIPLCCARESPLRPASTHADTDQLGQ